VVARWSMVGMVLFFYLGFFFGFFVCWLSIFRVACWLASRLAGTSGSILSIHQEVTQFRFQKK